MRSCLWALVYCFVQINPRLQRHFLAFAIAMPSPTSLLGIFETFLGGHLRQGKHGKRFQAGVLQVCANVIKGVEHSSGGDEPAYFECCVCMYVCI